MYYPEEMKAWVSPVQWLKPYRILAPTQDLNSGGRIRNHKRWPLHYHCTHSSDAPTRYDMHHDKMVLAQSCYLIISIFSDLTNFCHGVTSSHEISDHSLLLTNLSTRCQKHSRRSYQYRNLKDMTLSHFNKKIWHLLSSPTPILL